MQRLQHGHRQLHLLPPRSLSRRQADTQAGVIARSSPSLALMAALGGRPCPK
jgi:hypothetical protein